MEQLPLKKLSRTEGDVTIPGSKSLSNRILLLSALCTGTTKISNLLDSDDIKHMLTALKQLGVSYQLSDSKTEGTVEG